MLLLAWWTCRGRSASHFLLTFECDWKTVQPSCRVLRLRAVSLSSNVQGLPQGCLDNVSSIFFCDSWMTVRRVKYSLLIIIQRRNTANSYSTKFTCVTFSALIIDGRNFSVFSGCVTVQLLSRKLIYNELVSCRLTFFICLQRWNEIRNANSVGVSHARIHADVWAAVGLQQQKRAQLL